jgi:hypothetical protein
VPIWIISSPKIFNSMESASSFLLSNIIYSQISSTMMWMALRGHYSGCCGYKWLHLY